MSRTKTTTKPTTVEHAQKIIDQLQAKHQAAVAAAAADKHEMERLSFAAIAEEDAASACCRR